MSNPLVDYYRCPPELAAIGTQPLSQAEPGFFKFGGLVGFGRVAAANTAAYAHDWLPDVSDEVARDGGRVALPFDLAEVVPNLREERYRQNSRALRRQSAAAVIAHEIYYLLRPLLGVHVRKYLQRLRLAGWRSLSFPSWPVDVSVDRFVEQALILAMKAQGLAKLPFIWFWPNGAPAAVMMTHDIEGRAGVEFCDDLMDIDDMHAIKSAFQLIPKGDEVEWRQTAGRLRARGFEVNLHDLNHDGRLFAGHKAFLEQAARINRYAREFGCDGFRSGAMYREQHWYDAFEFAYDMSVPNVAHLEPQRGGCCTVMPYFVGNILELPLTTVQDYTLFFILNEYSTSLWERQISQIRQRHGLISIITHPDYLIRQRERDVYLKLVGHIKELRDRDGMWMALPGEINRWWRNRREMALQRTLDGWTVTGPESHRARVAYAEIQGEHLVYSFAPDGLAALA